ncbi:DUF3025 domain-containing protein [Alteromonas halophila]|uniref:DUF3025 domain-containing protein n=1 Tax=Alteromonas halophila TaxID=516698 RepID=A0A918JCK9_9ALTE|nr:DUF3025 domain-containing protein [Alteromonas halophila]GGW74416.1 hypothetical protein GCM10007391_02970 [Alteromonas halophila]
MSSERTQWQPDVVIEGAAPPVSDILQAFGLQADTAFPDASRLNSLASQLYDGNWRGPDFIDQGSLDPAERRYYEAIIAQDNCVPTREQSWHDLFNALIWLKFPRSKGLLNRLHMHDINDVGAHPRTPRRNRVTHFDECGVVLAVPASKLSLANALLSELADHQWLEAMYTQRSRWEQVIYPVVFGHANLEMLLSPFIGLTGKWLAVVVPDDYVNSSAVTQYAMLDAALETRIGQLGNFGQQHVLKPLPLLGVPGWHTAQTTTFYGNQEYFRPKRPSTPQTAQLPLTEIT